MGIKAEGQKQDLSILLVEDDRAFREQVVKLLGVYNDIAEAGTLAEARAALEVRRYDVVLLDKKLPDGNGLDLIQEAKLANRNSVVIILTADSNFNLVQKCIDAGAADYLPKTDNVIPDLLVRIPLAIRNASLQRKSEQLEARLKNSFRHEIIGCSAATADLRTTIQSMKGSLSNVLITGESGTGKELIARRLNAVEDRTRPFVDLNCSAIPEHLVESVLFGHVRGAFTGAVQDQIGKFELADGGDLFLDEIGELPLGIQAKLLRVLQEGEFSPTGSKRTIQVSVRVIAATNQPLEELIEQKKFRSDLYYRLNVFRINTVPLRDRPEDIADLVQYFMIKQGGPKFSISDEATKYLSRQTWPGNIRELTNTIERAVLSARRRNSTVIERLDVSQKTVNQPAPAGAVIPGVSLPRTLEDLSEGRYLKFLEVAEREFLKTALELCGDSPTEVANRVGVARSTLFRKLNELGLSRRPAAGSMPGLRSTQGTEEAEVAHDSP